MPVYFYLFTLNFSTSWTFEDCRHEERIPRIDRTQMMLPDQGVGTPSPVGVHPRMGPCDSSEWPEGANKVTDAGPEFHSCSSKQQVHPSSSSKPWIFGCQRSSNIWRGQPLSPFHKNPHGFLKYGRLRQILELSSLFAVYFGPNNVRLRQSYWNYNYISRDFQTLKLKLEG